MSYCTPSYYISLSYAEQSHQSIAYEKLIYIYSSRCIYGLLLAVLLLLLLLRVATTIRRLLPCRETSECKRTR